MNARSRTPYLDDYERRRRQTETANEQVVSTIATILLASMTAMEAFRAAVFGADSAADWPVRWLTMAALACHLAILAAIAWQPRYWSPRKYAVVVVRTVLIGLFCRVVWQHHLPGYALLLPTSLFVMNIVLTALSFSRAAVVLAGVLACVAYPSVTLLGPMWPASASASLFSVQVFVAVTAAAYWIVSRMSVMSDESVSHERLSRFFSPELASTIACEPEITLHASACRVTVLLSDISGFTAMSSRMTPEEVVGLLNAYFPRMVEIVFRHGGTLEKFIGDALLAVWGAPIASPDDVDRAVTAALEMRRALATFNAERREAGQPPIEIHVGIATGPAAAGYIGTDRYVQYAVIGDTTNVAARICSAAGPGEILVADETKRGYLGRDATFVDVPPIAAKGKDAAVVVHAVESTVSR